MSVSWSWRTWLWHISGMVDSNNNIFDYFEGLFELFAFTHVLTSLLEIRNLVIDNRSWVLQYTLSNAM